MTNGQQLWTDWTALWNGDLAVAERLVTDDFRAHFGRDIPTADDLRGPSELATFIGTFRAGYQSLRYHTDVGPIVDPVGGYVSCRWIADLQQGGTPDRHGGIDILRIAGDRVAEVWSVTGTRSLT